MNKIQEQMTERKLPRLMLQLQQLDSQISELEIVVNALSTVLVDVLVPHPSMNNSTAEAVVRTEFSHADNVVLDACNRIDDLQRRIRAIINAYED